MALGFFESSNDPSAPDSYDAMSRKRRLLDALLLKATDTSPVQHLTQGLARVLDSAGTSYQDAKLSEKEKDANLASSDYMKKLSEALSGGGSPSVMSAPAGASLPSTASADGSQSYRDAIASIESRGSGDYAALGPVTGKGDRAYGRYQVMGANIPEWTQAALGRSMTPQEFLASKEAQDKVFDHRFGGYVQKYGNPQDAASAWFTGRPLAQGGNARDQLGTSGLAYADKFTRALGQAPAQGAINGALRADMPAPGAQEAGGAPFTPPSPYGDLSGARDAIQQQNTLPGEPQNAQPPSVPLPPPRPNFPGETLPAGSPEAQAFTRLEGQPDPNAPAPGATPAQFAIPGASGADRGRALIAAALADPRLSPQQKQMALQMYTLTQREEGVTTIDLGNSVGIMDKRGNIVRTMPKQKDAQFGVIGKDAMGREQYGFIDPSRQSVSAIPGQAQPGSMVTIQTKDGPKQVPAEVAKDVQSAAAKDYGDTITGGKPLTEAQANANLFVTRMEKAEKVLQQTEKSGTSLGNRTLDWLPGGNYLRSDDAQAFDQAKRDFVNAVLRKESGAAIGKDEFANAEKQYFPQPGDGPRVIEQKRQNRATAIDGMRAAVGKNAPAPSPQAGHGAALSEARDAIAKGAPKEAVAARLREMGIDPGSL